MNWIALVRRKKIHFPLIQRNCIQNLPGIAKFIIGISLSGCGKSPIQFSKSTDMLLAIINLSDLCTNLNTINSEARANTLPNHSPNQRIMLNRKL